MNSIRRENLRFTLRLAGEEMNPSHRLADIPGNFYAITFLIVFKKHCNNGFWGTFLVEPCLNKNVAFL